MPVQSENKGNLMFKGEPFYFPSQYVSSKSGESSTKSISSKFSVNPDTFTPISPKHCVNDDFKLYYPTSSTDYDMSEMEEDKGSDMLFKPDETYYSNEYKEKLRNGSWS